ncbi:MAG: NADH-quinone oxidoreductase subunit L [Marinoscillum sp.]|uniref:NADH-quinone oxidoreductase subunit 5 family protein n=2 Tax=Marinoscillum sp. TaxID=2024838 RepID=UPI0032F7746E
MTTPAIYITLVLMFPLLGGVITYLSGSKNASRLSLMGMLPGAVIAGFLIYQSHDASLVVRWEWLPGYEFGWCIDRISAVLIGLVYLVSLLVHLFSAHYLSHDRAIHRYFGKLGFFTASMIGLLAADHFLLVFIFWELVGFSSYLLIGFWYEDVEKAVAARKAFMVNRVADAGLLIGVILMVTELNQPFLSSLVGGESSLLVHLAGFGLMIGALGKSAQFPFSGWLPKAMAGPTPVSALIHAATMVAAGVYLLIRVAPFLSPPVLNTTAAIGAVTAFMAAVSALTQHDIKKVLAYSTISQLGYMVMGIGAGAYQASLFHLWTHAFFKAGLFLAAGAVIHYLHTLKHTDSTFDAQDMRTMGGLKKVLPFTHVAFIICGLALSGLPLFSGFLSKEGILSGVWLWAIDHSANGYWWAYLVSDLAFVTALLTPIYIGRQILLVFHGTPRTALEKLPHMEPLGLVKVPLMVLSVGALWLVNALNPLDAGGWWLSSFLFGDSAGPGHGSIQVWTMMLSIALAVGGLAISYIFYRPGSMRSLGYQMAMVPAKWYRRLTFEGWYLESIYDGLSGNYIKVAKAARIFDRKVIDWLVNAAGVSTVVFSKALAVIDREVVDGLVNFVAWLFRGVGGVFTKIQSGKVQNQLIWMVLLLLVLVLWSQF